MSAEGLISRGKFLTVSYKTTNAVGCCLGLSPLVVKPSHANLSPKNLRYGPLMDIEQLIVSVTGVRSPNREEITGLFFFRFLDQFGSLLWSREQLCDLGTPSWVLKIFVRRVFNEIEWFISDITAVGPPLEQKVHVLLGLFWRIGRFGKRLWSGEPLCDLNTPYWVLNTLTRSI